MDFEDLNKDLATHEKEKATIKIINLSSIVTKLLAGAVSFDGNLLCNHQKISEAVDTAERIQSIMESKLRGIHERINNDYGIVDENI